LEHVGNVTIEMDSAPRTGERSTSFHQKKLFLNGVAMPQLEKLQGNGFLNVITCEVSRHPTGKPNKTYFSNIFLPL